jgi:hypothetical protein
MKSALVTFSTLAVVAMLGFDYAGGIDTFSARPDGDGVTLEWRSQAEVGIKSYAIERSDVRSTNDFQEAGTVMPSGNYSYYKYHDGRVNSAGLAGQNGGGAKTLANAYKYRLRMNLTSGEISYSQTVNVTTPSSGVRRTWGMIKEMFH